MRRFKKASDIKVGVVGYGGAFSISIWHIKQIKQAGMTLVAVADTDASRTKAAKKDFPGIQTYPSLGQMLKKSDVNLVVIVTPHSTHAPLALQALRAGRHVAVEKPLAITTAECDAMIAAAKKNKVLISTYHNRHWDGCITHALKAIRGGKIGEIVRIEAHMGKWGKPRKWWRTSKNISGGILYDWGVHLLEYTLQLIDSNIVEVGGYSKSGFWAPKTVWKKDTIEDEAFAVVRFSSGQWATLCHSSIDSNPKAGQLEITGTRGTYIFLCDRWQMIRQVGGKTLVTKGKNPPNEWWRYYKNIAEHLVKGTRLVITGQWSRRPIHILDLACRSAKAGKALKAKYK